MPNNDATKEIKKLLEIYLKVEKNIIEDLVERIDKAIDKTVLEEFKNIQSSIRIISTGILTELHTNKTPEEAVKAAADYINTIINYQSIKYKSADVLLAEAELKKDKQSSE